MNTAQYWEGSEDLDTSLTWLELEDVEMAIANVMSDLPLSLQTVTVEQPTTFHTEASCLLPPASCLLDTGTATEATEVRPEFSSNCLSVTMPETFQYEDKLEVSNLHSDHDTDDLYNCSEPGTLSQCQWDDNIYM